MSSIIKNKRDVKGKTNKGWGKGTANLISISSRNPEEAKALRSKGGKISAENKKQKKTIKEVIDYMLDHVVVDKNIIAKIKKIYPNIDVDRIALTYNDVMGSALIQRSFRPDAIGNKATEIIIDLKGERQPIKQEITGANGSAFMPPVFNTFFVDSKEELPE